ncbi:MAG: putative aminohydrolase SsnA [Halanaerobiales bacterium]|nr:putative aminohydrolase SsnA [Halanaerobiales bacterium]
MKLYGNGVLITLNSKDPVIKDGAILIDDDIIKDYGKTESLKRKYPKAEYLDVEGKVIMPGMINSHMHFYSTFARGMDLKTDIPPQNFEEILEKLWWRLDETMNSEDIYYSTLYALIDSIRNGTTTIFDHHASYGYIESSLDVIAEAVTKSNLRANLSYEISDRHGKEKSKKAIEENKRFINRTKSLNNDFITPSIGLHASFTLEDETLKEVAELAESTNTPMHFHAAEGAIDEINSRKRGYKNLADRLEKLNILKKDSLAIHGVHLSEAEYQILAENDVYLIHNPESNMGNAVGAINLKKALDKDLTVGLGTDGYTTDMFESINVADLLQKHDNSDPNLGGDDIRKIVFENNRKIAQKYFDKKLGIIEKNAPADVIMLDYKAPTPINKDNYFYHVVFGFNGGLVDTTIVNGNVLMENQEVKVLDYEKTIQKCQKQARDFWKRF